MVAQIRNYQQLNFRSKKTTGLRKFKPRQNFIDRQVIITGKPAEIDSIVGKVKQTLSTIPDIDIDADPWDSIVLNDDMEIRLYDIGPDESESAVWKVVEEIYSQAAADKIIVFADPNFITRDYANGQSGGVAGGSGGNTGGEAAGEAFRNHWAFKEQNGVDKNNVISWGISLESDEGRPTQEGAGVNIVILDTVDQRIISDVDKLADPDYAQDLGNVQPVEISRRDAEVTQTGRWTVDELAALNTLRLGFAAVSLTTPMEIVDERLGVDAHDVREHGVFVAGLAQRVAPQAELYLARVLDDHGHGDLFSLLQALHDLSGQLASTDMVLNLSLGAAVSVDAMIRAGVWDAVRDLYIATHENVTGTMMDLLDDLLKKYLYIPSLRMLVKRLHDAGVVIIAAAGNESANTYGHRPSQIPARYPEVIGVAASGKNGLISCFSNEGDVQAPGGSATGPGCDMRNLGQFCECQGDCRDYALISIVPRDSDNHSGFAYWRGTSFAAPMVSGLAALIIEKHKTLHGSAPTPAQVKAWIIDNAPKRVINVRDTLNAIL